MSIQILRSWAAGGLGGGAVGYLLGALLMFNGSRDWKDGDFRVMVSLLLLSCALSLLSIAVRPVRESGG